VVVRAPVFWPAIGQRASHHALPLACVIGAGPAGLTAAKALADRGIPFDCFERSSRVGGLWAYGNPEGTPTAYRSLRINTSKARTELEDFPMPASYPDFPDHEQIARYLEAYAQRFGLMDRINLDTEVVEARPDANGTWQVMLSDGQVRHYDAIVVANGHHWHPRWPEPSAPGAFSGTVIHSRDYYAPERFAGQRVVVVGLGNSAMDIAVDLAPVAARVFLSARRGAHILPRRLRGRPLDQVELMAPAWLPWWVRERISGALVTTGLRREARRPQDYGLPVPSHKLHQAHPTLSDEIFDALASGDVVACSGLAALEGDRVRFDDGSTEAVDAIVYCTGYRTSFPFFDPRLISAPGNDLPLYVRIFHPEHPGVLFAGLVQPIGPTIRVVEEQARLIAAHLSGAHALPPAARMRRRMQRERDRVRRRYIPSARHTMQVDYPAYMRAIATELRAGARRARRRDYRPSVEPRAALKYARASPSAQAA
jgi:dimethylaniline monooxygenase (N-oxide forming)